MYQWKRKKKNLTKKILSIDLKRSRTKNVQCHRTNSNCFILTQLDTKPITFFSSSVIGMHWFLRPSTASWRWCFYLWIVFIVGLSIPSHFFPFVTFFNAKYHIFLFFNQNQLTAVFVSNTFIETINTHQFGDDSSKKKEHSVTNISEQNMYSKSIFTYASVNSTNSAEIFEIWRWFVILKQLFSAHPPNAFMWNVFIVKIKKNRPNKRIILKMWPKNWGQLLQCRWF